MLYTPFKPGVLNVGYPYPLEEIMNDQKLDYSLHKNFFGE